MQLHRMSHSQVEKELDEVKTQLSLTERERDRAFDELREIKRSMMKNTELNNTKEALQDAIQELQIKDKTIEFLRLEVDKRKQLELKLIEMNASLQVMEERLQDKFEVDRDNADRANKGEKYSSLDVGNLLDDIDALKIELQQAMEAEENSKKAMDDLAFALKEVASESNHAKEKLESTEQQLEAVKEEAVNLKKMIKSNEETYEALLKELKKENDQMKNTLERLRLEAEESLLAWNDKETQFVKCIKKVEDEKNAVQEECNKMGESLQEAKGISDKSKEENRKLRDILKQALSEANMASEAASLARAENSYLKDSLTEKDKALVTLAQETERLLINEAEANERNKESKRVITLGLKKEAAKLDKEKKEQKKMAKKETAAENADKEPKEGRRLSSAFSFDLLRRKNSHPPTEVANPHKEIPA